MRLDDFWSLKVNYLPLSQHIKILCCPCQLFHHLKSREKKYVKNFHTILGWVARQNIPMLQIRYNRKVVNVKWSSKFDLLKSFKKAKKTEVRPSQYSLANIQLLTQFTAHHLNSMAPCSEVRLRGLLTF